MDIYGRPTSDSLSNGGIINGDLLINGNETVTGTLTTTDLVVLDTSITVDPLLHVGAGNPGDGANLGLFWEYKSGTTKYGGLIRDKNTGIVSLFQNEATEPTPLTDVSTYPLADLELKGLDASTVTITAPGASYTLPLARGAARTVMTDPLGNGVVGFTAPPTSVIIWRPGGISDSNVATTWGEVASVINTQYDAVTVYVDTSIMGTALIDVPVNCGSRVVIDAAKYNAGSAANILMADDVQLTDLFGITGPVGFITSSVTVPSLVLTQGAIMEISNGATLAQGPNGLVPPIQIPPGNSNVITVANGAGFAGPTAIPYIQLGSGSTLIFPTISRSNPAPWNGNEIAGPADSFIDWINDSTAPELILPGFSGTLNMQGVSNALHTTYNDVGSPSIGGTVDAALNYLKTSSVESGRAVYQPGGVTGNGVYATWAEIVAYIGVQTAQTAIYFDTSITSPANIDADVDCRGLVTFYPAVANSLVKTQVNVIQGIQISNLAGLVGSINLVTNSDTVAALAFASSSAITLDEGSAISQGGGTTLPTIIMSPSQTLGVIFKDGGAVTASGIPFCTLDSASVVALVILDAVAPLGGNEFTGPADAIIALITDATMPTVNWPSFTGIFSHALVDKAAGVDYDDSAVSPPLGSSTVQGAIDALKAATTTPVFTDSATINRATNATTALLKYSTAGVDEWDVGTLATGGPLDFAIRKAGNPYFGVTPAGDVLIEPVTKLEVVGQLVEVISSTLNTATTLQLNTVFPAAPHFPQIEFAKQNVTQWRLLSDAASAWTLTNLLDGGGAKTAISIASATTRITLNDDVTMAGALTLNAVGAPTAPTGNDGVIFKLAGLDGLFWQTAGLGPVNIALQKKYMSAYITNAVFTPTSFGGANTYSNWVTSAPGATLGLNNGGGEWTLAANPGSSITYNGARSFIGSFNITMGYESSVGVPATRFLRVLKNGGFVAGTSSTLRSANGATYPNNMAITFLVALSQFDVIQPQVGNDADTTDFNIYQYSITMTEVP